MLETEPLGGRSSHRPGQGQRCSGLQLSMAGGRRAGVQAGANPTPPGVCNQELSRTSCCSPLPSRTQAGPLQWPRGLQLPGRRAGGFELLNAQGWEGRRRLPEGVRPATCWVGKLGLEPRSASGPLDPRAQLVIAGGAGGSISLGAHGAWRVWPASSTRAGRGTTPRRAPEVLSGVLLAVARPSAWCPPLSGHLSPRLAGGGVGGGFGFPLHPGTGHPSPGCRGVGPGSGQGAGASILAPLAGQSQTPGPPCPAGPPGPPAEVRK